MQKSDDSLNGETSISRDTTQVNFVCQQCFRPLKLDPSLFSINTDTERDLSSTDASALSSTIDTRFSLHSHCSHAPDAPETTSSTASASAAAKPPTPTCGESQIVTKTILPARNELKGGSGFTLIEDVGGSGGGSNANAKYRADVCAKLFDIMSGNADIDHPLCEECTDVLLNKLDDQLHHTEKELSNYKQLYVTLEQQRVLDDTELDEELRQLQLEEKELVEQLAAVELEYEGMLAEREDMAETNKLMDVEEEAYWREYCDHQKLLLEFEEQQASTHNYLNYAQTQLDKLRKTNVFNSTFHIWHKGHFGTINNFRLGRLPSVPVEWTEINAAWGQTVLLLHSLAKKIGLVFRGYRLVPYGNHSYIDCLDDKNKELPLYGSGGFRFFWDTKFDHAMVAFLDCLQQFKQEVEKGDSKFHLPYRMERGKIYDSSGSGAYSVKIQFNSEEHWTKALKFMLTNLKWGLAWVSSQFADKNS